MFYKTLKPIKLDLTSYGGVFTELAYFSSISPLVAGNFVCTNALPLSLMFFFAQIALCWVGIESSFVSGYLYLANIANCFSWLCKGVLERSGVLLR